MRRLIAIISLPLLGAAASPAVAAGPYDWAKPAAQELVWSGAWSPQSASDLSVPATRRELAAGLRLLADDAERAAWPTPEEPEPGVDTPAGEFPDRADAPGDPTLEQPPAHSSNPWAEFEADPALPRRARALASGLERRPDARVSAQLGHRIVVRALGFREERERLGGLALGSTRLRVPPHFATEILARELGLRHNYPSQHERHERGRREVLARADVAGMVSAARQVDSDDRFRLSRFRSIALPAAGRRRTAVVAAAIGYVGHVYVWGGDWPNRRSPWGWQASGGFDCSGLAWMAYKGTRQSVRLGLGRALGGRVADEMAWERPRETIPAEQAQPGDLIFLGDKGRSAGRGDITHMGIALGGGWMIHSSGSRAGVSISHLDDYWPEGLSHARRLAALRA